MSQFKPYDYNQDAMVVINFAEQIQPGTFEVTLHQLIETHIDLSAFYDQYNGHGRQVAFTVESGKTATDWMKRRVDSAKGKLIYSHRMSVVEPVFGNIGTNKGLNRFSLRGKDKVQGQWQLFCLVHNIEKIAHYGHMGLH
jgi:hypothetical protein